MAVGWLYLPSILHIVWRDKQPPRLSTTPRRRIRATGRCLPGCRRFLGSGLKKYCRVFRMKDHRTKSDDEPQAKCEKNALSNQYYRSAFTFPGVGVPSLIGWKRNSRRLFDQNAHGHPSRVFLSIQSSSSLLHIRFPDYCFTVLFLEKRLS